MSSWREYWDSRGHNTKKVCSQFPCIDSFGVFSENPNILTIHTLRIYAQLESEGFIGTCEGYPFFLKVEKQECNYGGYRYFFKCGSCCRRMRKVYFSKRKFSCRKCLNLSYKSQQLTAFDRFSETKMKLIDSLKLKHGSDFIRPRRMWKSTYEKKLERISMLETKDLLAFIYKYKLYI